jgi:hypothetical protein
MMSVPAASTYDAIVTREVQNPHCCLNVLLDLGYGRPFKLHIRRDGVSYKCSAGDCLRDQRRRSRRQYWKAGWRASEYDARRVTGTVLRSGWGVRDVLYAGKIRAGREA